LPGGNTKSPAFSSQQLVRFMRLIFSLSVRVTTLQTFLITFFQVFITQAFWNLFSFLDLHSRKLVWQVKGLTSRSSWDQSGQY